MITTIKAILKKLRFIISPQSPNEQYLNDQFYNVFYVGLLLIFGMVNIPKEIIRTSSIDALEQFMKLLNNPDGAKVIAAMFIMLLSTVFIAQRVAAVIRETYYFIRFKKSEKKEALSTNCYI